MNRTFAGAAIFALSFLLTASCMKKPDLKDDDGPQAQARDVQQTLLDAWGEASMLSVDAGEFSSIYTTVEIADFPPIPRQQDSKTVAAVQDLPDRKVFDILQRTVEIISDTERREASSHMQPAPYVLKDEVASVTQQSQRLTEQGKKSVQAMALGNVNALAALALPLPDMTMLTMLCVCTEGLCGYDPDWHPTCHNLQGTRETEPAPELVAKKAGCGGLPDCKVRKNAVSFDVIAESKDPNSHAVVRSKSRITIKISPDVPYLSRITDYCTESLQIASGSQAVPVKICQTLKDFERGTPP